MLKLQSTCGNPTNWKQILEKGNKEFKSEKMFSIKM